MPDPTPSRSSARLLADAFLDFARIEAASGILLLAATVAALLWANSSWAHSYHALWDGQMPLGIGSLSLSLSRHDWVNDGLMAIFFFVVGLEIKREVLIGELASARRAAFPFLAALGGSIVPALIYLKLNGRGAGVEGWGVPIATDIAFALGVLAVLGSRVPPALKVFVAALAIVDDIFAVLVIALFYTHHISLVALSAAFAGIAVSVLANRLGVHNLLVYAVIGAFVWFAVFHSGVHATVAGVLMAFTIPAKTRPRREKVGQHDRKYLEGSQTSGRNPPLYRMEHILQPWVGFLIMPLFALSNAGVPVLGRLAGAFVDPVAIGIFWGLLLGKPLGIMSFAALSSVARVASRPASVSWAQIFAASWLCGIGFTMSLFIAALAFKTGDLLDTAKIAILGASVAAGIVGSLLLWALEKGKPPAEKALASSAGA